jgi:hypothetical protein
MDSKFPGGVKDFNGVRGYVELPARTVVAIDLCKGKVLWQRDNVGRPLAATADRLITVDAVGQRVVLRVLDAQTGSDAGQIANTSFPDWLAKDDRSPQSLAVEASPEADGIRLQWAARRFYHGGAPPPQQIEHATTSTSGAMTIDPDTLQFTTVAPSTDLWAQMEPSTEISSSGNTLSSTRGSDKDFSLSVQEEGVVLEAKQHETGKVLWELTVSPKISRFPNPLRM